MKHEGYLLLRNNLLHFYDLISAVLQEQLIQTEQKPDYNEMPIFCVLGKNAVYSENIFLSFI